MKQKNITKTLYCIAAGLLMVSCSEEGVAPVDPSNQDGNEVTFLIGNDTRDTRTMYAADGWESETAESQTIFWGDYLETLNGTEIKGTDQIRIFCAQGAGGRQVATYDVTPDPKGNNVAQSVSRSAGQTAGVQWGKQADHTFYAFYPASHCETAFSNGREGFITAQVEAGQSPVTYKAVRGGTTQANNALEWLGTNQGAANASDITTIYGQPDMSAAVMAAKTTVAAADNGQPVSLNFSVLADVLDLTINGPVTPNNLLGDNASTAPGSWQRREFIHIQNVTIESVSNTPISGNFTLDLTGYDAQGENGPTGYKVSVVNGNNTVQLQTAQVTPNGTYNPLLHIRSENAKEVDKLRLRAFLIPGQVKNLSDLKVTVETDCGVYTQTLGSQEMVTGQIHRVKFPFFQQPGLSFDFTKWMGQLNDQIYLTELSLPGTFAAYSFGSNAKPQNQYQTLNITQQYDAGIRAFQLNVSSTDNHYAPFMSENANVTLDDVLNNIGQCMQSHSKEVSVVILSYKYPVNGETLVDQNTWLSRIKDVINNNRYVYRGPVTSETTIADVVGQGNRRIIVKINSAGNETVTGVDAMFASWSHAGAIGIDTQPLTWGSVSNDTGMRWCYMEADNIGDAGTNHQLSVEAREKLVVDFVDRSLELYNEAKHNTWFFCAISGFINGESSEAKNAGVKENSPVLNAEIFNPYMNQVLSNANRQACPMGIVMMNFAGAQVKGNETDQYSSAALIRTIINNNRAFTLQKKGATSTVVEKTNANFTSGSKDAVK